MAANTKLLHGQPTGSRTTTVDKPVDSDKSNPQRFRLIKVSHQTNRPTTTWTKPNAANVGYPSRHAAMSTPNDAPKVGTKGDNVQNKERKNTPKLCWGCGQVGVEASNEDDVEPIDSEDTQVIDIATSDAPPDNDTELIPDSDGEYILEQYEDYLGAMYQSEEDDTHMAFNQCMSGMYDPGDQIHSRPQTDTQIVSIEGHNVIQEDLDELEDNEETPSVETIDNAAGRLQAIGSLQERPATMTDIALQRSSTKIDRPIRGGPEERRMMSCLLRIGDNTAL
ncbi:hypothetical protein F5890DRAFT_1560266, partial [Lentinula detonsa]